MSSQPNNPLHGVTLEQILVALVDNYGWDALGSHQSRVALCSAFEKAIKVFICLTKWQVHFLRDL